MRSCWERLPLPAKRRRSSNQSENILASRVNSRNNIHLLKVKEVRHSQCQSMSRRSQATVNSSQICSQATTPTTTSTHLGPKSTAPWPLHHGTHCTPNWCLWPCYLTSRLWPRPDHEMHSASNLDARNKRVNSNRLISSLQKGFLALQSRRAKSWPTHQTYLNVFKHHLPHLYTHPFFGDGLKKPLQNHREENQSVVPWCLWDRGRLADSDGWWFD